MLRQARIIRSIIFSLVIGVFEYATFFKYLYKKKSRLDKSGDLEHHDIGPPRSIHLPENVRSKWDLTLLLPSAQAHHSVERTYVVLCPDLQAMPAIFVKV